MAPLGHLEFQARKGNQGSQDPLDSLVLESLELQGFMGPQGSPVPLVLKASLAFQGPQDLQDHLVPQL